MKIQRNTLLAALAESTRELIHRAEAFKERAAGDLNRKANSEAWSCLECLEHLNRYGDFYLPEIEGKLLKADSRPDAREYRSGMLGDYFVKVVRPGEASKAMKTQGKMNPNGSELPLSTIDRFLKQQKMLLGLMERAEKVHLGKVRISITLTPFVKLKLGDALRFLVAHNERHLAQAERSMRSN